MTLPTSTQTSDFPIKQNIPDFYLVCRIKGNMEWQEEQRIGNSDTHLRVLKNESFGTMASN